MKAQFLISIALLAAACLTARGQAGASYTNFLRQVQLPSNVRWDVPVSAAGTQLSPLAIDPGGARFELWSVRDEPLTVFLLDTKFVGTYIPVAGVVIRTEDPYSVIPRTRADRPFIVDITTAGLRSEVDAPTPAKSVKLLRHVQSYGTGFGDGIDRSQATLVHQVFLTNNATHRMSYAMSAVPAAAGQPLNKVRGEERFSVFSLADYQAPESQLASLYVQIWPIADGSIVGISANQTIRFTLPSVRFVMNDLYPDSRTYAQVYPGEQRLGAEGTVVPGSALVVYEAEPQSRDLTVSNWDNAITSDGRWTLELITATPFGLERLAHVTFNVDRTIDANGSFTTIE